MIICMVLRSIFRIKCKVFSLISFLGPQRVKGDELYLRSVKWQQKTANEEEMQKKKKYTAGNLHSLLDLLQVCGQRCCSLWLRIVIVNFACDYHHHSKLCGFRHRIHEEIPSITNKRKTKVSLTASKSVT